MRSNYTENVIMFFLEKLNGVVVARRDKASKSLSDILQAAKNQYLLWLLVSYWCIRELKAVRSNAR